MNNWLVYDVMFMHPIPSFVDGYVLVILGLSCRCKEKGLTSI